MDADDNPFDEDDVLDRWHRDNREKLDRVAAPRRKMSIAEWRKFDALADLVDALENSQSVDNWPKRKREVAAKGLRMLLGSP